MIRSVIRSMLRSMTLPVVAFVSTLMLAAVAPAAAPAPSAPTAAAEGKRLLKEGNVAQAAAKLSEAWAASTRDPEVLFDLAVCYQRLGKPSDALAAFRSYLEQPLALRLRAAEDRIRAIEARSAKGVPSEPRRVLVPISIDGGRCFGECTRIPRCSSRDPYCRPRFDCMSACGGARVETGLCATAQPRPGERCHEEAIGANPKLLSLPFK